MLINTKEVNFRAIDGLNYRSVICFCLDYNLNEIDDFKKHLHQEELVKYQSILSSESRNSFLFGRFCAKTALSKFCDIKDLSQILIVNGVFGQPIVKNNDIFNIKVSISHSKGLICAVAFEESHPLAIDVEKIDQKIDKNLADNFVKAELELFKGFKLLPNEYNLILWTAKESLGKMLKTGLTTPLKLFEIDTVSRRGLDSVEFLLTYRNFVQYRVLSCLIGDYVCSISYPKNSEIDDNFFFSSLI